MLSRNAQRKKQTVGWCKITTWVMDHFTITFLATTLNMVARYFT